MNPPNLPQEPEFNDIQRQLSEETRLVLRNYLEPFVGNIDITCTPTTPEEVFEEIQRPSNKFFTLVEVTLSTSQKVALRNALPTIREMSSDAKFVDMLEAYCDDLNAVSLKFLLVAKHSAPGKGKSERMGYHKLAQASINTVCCILPQDLSSILNINIDGDLVITYYERGVMPVFAQKFLFEPAGGVMQEILHELAKCHNRSYILGDPWFGNIITKFVGNRPKVFFVDLEDFKEVTTISEEDIAEEFRSVFRYIPASLRTQKNKENVKEMIRSDYLPSLSLQGIDNTTLQAKLDAILDFAFEEYDDV